MIIDFIADNITDKLSTPCPIPEEEWDYLCDLAEELNLLYVYDIAMRKLLGWEVEPNAFKKAMIRYMKEFGYEGCIIYNRFERLDMNTIEKFIA